MDGYMHHSACWWDPDAGHKIGANDIGLDWLETAILSLGQKKKKGHVCGHQQNLTQKGSGGSQGGNKT